MKKLILTLATIATLISCNKEELKPQCDCKVTYEMELFGTWYQVWNDNSTAQIEIDTLLDCSLDGQVTPLEEYNYTRREIITCD